jgi:hypothetical protein
MDGDDRTHFLLTQILAEMAQIKALLPRLAPNLTYPIDRFSSFDWHSIGATVLERDRHGATVVSWAGRIYFRRSPSNKFDAAIWFSRCTGKGEDGTNSYERLVTFKAVKFDVSPVPDKVARHLAAIAN